VNPIIFLRLEPDRLRDYEAVGLKRHLDLRRYVKALILMRSGTPILCIPYRAEQEAEL
jgi:hypothetical protein